MESIENHNIFKNKQIKNVSRTTSSLFLARLLLYVFLESSPILSGGESRLLLHLWRFGSEAAPAFMQGVGFRWL
jgi:hypothetical protein